MLSVLALLVDASPAQTTATLLEGESLVAPCLSDATCGSVLRGLLSENMAEVGYVLQIDPMATSALGNKGIGPVVELRFDSVALGADNALEQQVALPPGLPRVAVGYQLGSYTYDDPYPQVAVGLAALPPVTVLGGTLFSLQGDVSGAVPVVVPHLWAGAELGYGFGQLAAPLLGSRDQLEELPVIEPFLPPAGDEACATLVRGCLDRFRQHAVHARAGISVEPVPAAFLVARVAVVGLVQRLAVAYDDTTWGAGGAQLQGQLGGGVRAGDAFQLSAGGVIAPRPEAQDTTGNPLLAKASVAMAFRFGPARYWERDEPVEGP